MASLLLRGARQVQQRQSALLALTLANGRPSSGTFNRLAARSFATDGQTAGASNGMGKWLLWGGVLAGGAYLGNTYYREGSFDSLLGAPPSSSNTKAKPDYNAVKKMVASLLEKDEDYDDGSYGPLLVRLAWHSSGSYDKDSKTGGSNGATMRYKEGEYGANAGLKVARDLLEPVKAKFPWISYADLWTLAGVTAIEEMGGPEIKWRPGRSDYDGTDPTLFAPDGRLPDGSLGAKHIRDVFYRMGFNDQEIVALSGAHSMGRCHTTRSGFDGPWTHAPTAFSNLYFQELLNRRWYKRRWNGPLQYRDKESEELMMLPTDMALLWDKKFKPYVKQYAEDAESFAADFASAFSKLLELGVPFDTATQVAPPGLKPNMGSN